MIATLCYADAFAEAGSDCCSPSGGSMSIRSRNGRFKARTNPPRGDSSRPFRDYLAPGPGVLGEGVDTLGDLLRRLNRGLVPNARKRLQDGSGDAGQKLALTRVYGVDLVVFSGDHDSRRLDVADRFGDVLVAGLPTPSNSRRDRAPFGVSDQKFEI